MRIKRTRRGAQMLQGGAILSEILAEPAATHSVFDLLAALVHLLAPGPRVAMLGFAGGGMLAPLRALERLDAGAAEAYRPDSEPEPSARRSQSKATERSSGSKDVSSSPALPKQIRACDLDLTGAKLFDEIAGPWAGDLLVDEADAVDWIQERRDRFDAIVEDLSELGPEGETKPAVSAITLPQLIAKRLSSQGIVITNLLPVPRVSWRALEAQVLAPWPQGIVLELFDWENRIAIASKSEIDARKLATRLDATMAALDSELRKRFRCRTR